MEKSSQIIVQARGRMYNEPMTELQRQLIKEHLPKFTRDFDRTEVVDKLIAAGILNDDKVRTVGSDK
jgi:hypothetical protein